MTDETFDASPRSGTFTVMHASAVAMATQNALWSAIEMLAAEKGTEDLSWLDQLEASAISEAKGTVAEGVDIVVEADALQYGVDVIDACFKAYRARLIKSKAP